MLCFSFDSFFSCLFYFCFILLCFVCFIISLLMTVCFLTRERKGVDLGGRGGREDLGVAGERETIIRLYCMKNLFFNKGK